MRQAFGDTLASIAADVMEGFAGMLDGLVVQDSDLRVRAARRALRRARRIREGRFRHGQVKHARDVLRASRRAEVRRG